MRWLIVLMAASLVLAACGGDEGATEDSESALTEAAEQAAEPEPEEAAPEPEPDEVEDADEPPASESTADGVVDPEGDLTDLDGQAVTDPAVPAWDIVGFSATPTGWAIDLVGEAQTGLDEFQIGSVQLVWWSADGNFLSSITASISGGFFSSTADGDPAPTVSSARPSL